MFRRLLAAGVLAMAAFSSSALAGDPLAATAAANGSACTAARPFYWEIGDVGGPLVSGQVGGTLYNRNSRMNLASASKWPLGAYILERYAGAPPPAVRDAAFMLTGYKPFNQLLCTLAPTVKGCFNMIGNNVQDPGAVGEFFYSGGNSQYVAASPSLLDMGDFTTAQLTAEVQLTLGTTMEYQYPALPAGLEGSAAEYAEFLIRMMTPPASGGLVMHDHLGVDTIPTLPCPPGQSGCTAAGTVAWSYGYHYWIEDNATAGQFNPPLSPVVGPGDGAYSSAGAWGFYPWISADKSLYGIVARRGLLGTAFRASAICGQAIRYAYTGYTP
ncbi:hypothetical protein [Luteimonas aestuarii]|uniref:hypothetical protein n=1 Tax=Luteimonas aestuarii TaxID=453837 RepID=UPI0014053B67|nr:hypothetical protein [Luteimonas aestuarii]